MIANVNPFALRLKKLRVEKAISQYKLAELLGFSRGQIANYEQGRREPDHSTLQKIAAFFNVSTDYLLGNDGTSFATPEIIKVIDKKMPKDLKKILEQQEIMFSGTPLDEEDRQEILDIIQYHLYKRAKELNKRKPKGAKPNDRP